MRLWMFLGCAGLILGQGTEPKQKADDYEIHAQARNAAVGAEFMVHSFSRGEQTFIAQNYLVVEIAFFPPKDTKIVVQNGDFWLQINGKKQLVEAAAPSMVAASLQHPEWEQPGGLTPSVGGRSGNIGVTMGGPPYNPTPFPGSNPPGTQMPPRVPVPRDNPSGVEKEHVNAGDLLIQTALVEGEHHAAFSGFLYFPYRGKISSIKSLELIYQDVVLKLR